VPGKTFPGRREVAISPEERTAEFEEEERRAALRAILGLFARGASDAVGVFFAKHRALLEESAVVERGLARGTGKQVQFDDILQHEFPAGLRGQLRKILA